MPTVNELLFDELTAHAVDLQQYSDGVARRMIALLNRVDADLSAELAAALERMPADSFTVERLEALLGSVRQVNAAAYASVTEALQSELRAFAAYEAGYQSSLYQSVIPAAVQVRYSIASVSPNQVYSAAMSRPFQGSLLKDFAKELGDSRMAKIRNAIRIGYVEGKTASEIVRAIRGSSAANYADGILQRPRRDLMAVVNTAISHTASVAREQFVSANSELIKAEVWRSTLDARTTAEFCVPRDGKQYTPVTHKPIGHKMPWLGGPGRLHWNCRSTSVPVTKSWKELGIPIEEISPSERASQDGQVPAETTYAEWIKRQPASRQDRVLGAERARMMREGKVRFDELYKPNGRLLTLEELKQKDAEYFEKMRAA